MPQYAHEGFEKSLAAPVAGNLHRSAGLDYGSQLFSMILPHASVALSRALIRDS
jgi:hypothetical protein